MPAPSGLLGPANNEDLRTIATIFQDDFNRADGALGSNWTVDVNASGTAAIISNEAYIFSASNVGSYSRAEANIAATTDFDVTVRASRSSTTGNAFSIPVAVRHATWSAGYSSGYGLYLSGSNVILRRGTSTIETLGTYASNTYYFWRIRAVGDQIKAKYWEEGTEEPEWQVEVTDTSVASGGLAMANHRLNSTANSISVDSIVATDGVDTLDVSVPAALATADALALQPTVDAEGLDLAVTVGSPTADALAYTATAAGTRGADWWEEHQHNTTPGGDFNLGGRVGRISGTNYHHIVQFNGMQIPQGSAVTNAYLTIPGTRTGTGNISATVYAYDADQAIDFAAGDTVLQIPYTTASVAWSNIGDNRTSPDLGALLTEVVQRPGWTAGNRIVLYLLSNSTDNNYINVDKPLLDYDVSAPNNVAVNVNTAQADAEAFDVSVDTTKHVTMQLETAQSTSFVYVPQAGADRSPVVDVLFAEADGATYNASTVIANQADVAIGAFLAEADATSYDAFGTGGFSGGVTLSSLEASAQSYSASVDFTTEVHIYPTAAYATSLPVNLPYDYNVDPYVMRVRGMNPTAYYPFQGTQRALAQIDERDANQPATISGTVQLGQKGLYDRDVLTFTTLSDYVDLPAGYEGGEASGGAGIRQNAIEFTMRTTQQNGTIIQAVDGSHVYLADGFLRLGGTNLATQAYVADGNWHHIYIDASYEAWTQTGHSTYYIYVDGKLVNKRIRRETGTNIGVDPNRIGTGFIGQIQDLVYYTRGATLDSRDLILSHTDIQRNWLASIYGAFPVEAVGAQADASALPAKGKGNQLRALAIYAYRGATGASGSGYRRGHLADYEASGPTDHVGQRGIHWSGLLLPGTVDDQGREITSLKDYAPTDWGPYKLHYRNVYQRELMTPSSQYIDLFDEQQRYINLDTDIDATQFDLLVIVDSPPRGAVGTRTRRLYEDWIVGLRKAVDKGVPLWLAHPQIATDLGLCDGYESVDLNIQDPDLWAYNRIEQFKDGWGEPANTYRWPIETVKPVPEWYLDNNYLHSVRVVNEIPGLTDIPDWRVKHIIGYMDASGQQNYYDEYFAIDHVQAPNGLKPGDEVRLHPIFRIDLGWRDDLRFWRHRKITGVRPGYSHAGIPVTMGQQYDHVANSNVPSATADMVTSFVVEPGMPVDGKPIGARVYVDFNNTQPTEYMMGRDVPKEGYTFEDTFPSTHDVDLRRRSFTYQNVRIDEVRLVGLPGSGDKEVQVHEAFVGQYVPGDDPVVTVADRKHVPMLARGINWLRQSPEPLPDGYAQVYAVRATADAQALAPTVTTDRTLTVQVDSPTAQAQALPGFVNGNRMSPDATVLVSAASATARALPPQRIVHVPTATANAEALPATVKAEGEGVVFTLATWAPTFDIGVYV